jgi:CRISPR-associated protein Csb1
VDGRSNVLCVLVDSVQSQANRLEEALQAARDAKELSFPTIAVEFGKTEIPDVGRITALQAPHRIFDAIIRDAEMDGVRFNDTEQGRRLVEAKPRNARAVYDLAPTALVFGAWNSTGEGGGLGAKFPRAVVSEIVGVGVAFEEDPETRQERPSGQRTGSRIDPLGIRSGVRVFKAPNGDWSLDPPKGTKGVKEVKPSEINHSNIAPTVTPLGVSVDHLLHTFVLSFPALRRNRFTGSSGAPSDGDSAAQATLAALGLAAATAQDQAGYFLRSRCDLVPEAGSGDTYELIHADGSSDAFTLTFDEACQLVAAAAEKAAATDLRWRDQDLVLVPQAKLVALVRQSREKALQGETEPKDE